MELHLGALPGNYESGESYSDVLGWNHHGTETIPPRPVLRIAAEKTIPKNSNRFKAYLHNLLVNPKDAKRLETVLLTTLGQQSVAEAKRIIDNITDLQENAEATIAKKHFNQPLYENGDLEDHLGFEITD